jgi:uncharacterized protein YdhG (YjbR/CyaY superfamily)
VAKTVDEYLNAVEDPNSKAALAKMRDLIRKSLPEGEEVISYGIPTYKFFGMVASFAAFKDHCSFFPGHTVSDFAEDLKDFKTSKGTIHFTPDHPIPDDLIVAMIQYRAAENLTEKMNKRSG